MIQTVLSISILLLSAIISKAGKPHIIFIMGDDMGWNDVSYHGSDQIPTPNIDCLAYNGVILNNMYTMPTCTPSRAAFLTGKYPIHTGMQGPPLSPAKTSGLPQKERLLPQFLKELGYTNRMIGKWHLGFCREDYIPLNRGFDSHFGYYTGYIGYYNHIGQSANGDLDDFSGQDLRDNRTIRYDLEGRYATDLFTDEAVRLIEEHPVDKPLFLYMAHLAAHAGNKGAALEAPQETVAKFRHIGDPNRRIYAAMVSKLDDSVGRVVEALGKKKMLENSIIIFMSDNGAPSNVPSVKGDHVNWGSNYPLRGVKETLWSGGVRSPTVIWSPRLQKNPRVSKQLMHMTDWLPTLISAADGDLSRLPKDLDGINQWETILNNTPSPRKSLLINIDEKRKFAAVVEDSWKLITGKFLDGTCDSFYGDQSKYPGSPYQPSKVTQSAVCQQFSELSQRYGLAVSDEERMLTLREAATVRCPNAARVGRSPCGDGPCLFNLDADPCETKNLAESHTNITSHLLDLLKNYERGLVPQIEQTFDPRGADPMRFNCSWQPWVQ